MNFDTGGGHGAQGTRTVAVSLCETNERTPQTGSEAVGGYRIRTALWNFYSAGGVSFIPCQVCEWCFNSLTVVLMVFWGVFRVVLRVF